MRVTFLAAIFFILLTACNNHGKRVKINDSTEVYVKGEDVSEDDAKKLGNYIESLTKDGTNEKSLQLSKDSGMYVVRMVVNEEKLKTDSTIDVSFIALKSLIELEVFKNNRVKLIVTNDQFMDIKT